MCWNTSAIVMFTCILGDWLGETILSVVELYSISIWILCMQNTVQYAAHNLHIWQALAFQRGEEREMGIDIDYTTMTTHVPSSLHLQGVKYWSFLAGFVFVQYTRKHSWHRQLHYKKSTNSNGSNAKLELLLFHAILMTYSDEFFICHA